VVAVGVDRRAPAAAGYLQMAFEQYEWPHRFNAVVLALLVTGSLSP
jgi:hypothetical protein